ncbi:MAG: membrane protein insertion efficiency factor YidD [Rhodospirillales bacterium]|nr:membrane protein insertion efficiency factor YidD [Rhodospirillales bacterium]
MNRIAAALMNALIAVYRYGISPFTPMSCRYMPTCSAYAEEAIRRHGPWRGGGLALRRVSRCHPLGGHGYDPVPETASGSGPGRLRSP